MSYVDVTARVAEIRELVARSSDPATPVVTAAADAADGQASPGAFGAALASLAPEAVGASGLDLDALIEQVRIAAPDSLLATLLAPAPPWLAGGSTGQQMLEIARGELGQREEPPGSNDGPRIAQYRGAVAGSYAGGAWCAYFISWLAQQAGMPIGTNGAGEGAVEGIQRWAEATGRLLPAGSPPQPGDVILYGGDHVGVVESVNADGSLTTIEGNHRNAVEQVQRSPAEATGFVRI